jgi:hypothetical protein
MRFVAFKEFRQQAQATIEAVGEYLSHDLRKVLRELQAGLTKLSFDENFDSFTEVVTIAASSEVKIRNKVRDAIPRYKIIVRDNGSGVVDGDEAWSLDFVTLKNTSASSKTVTVIFFK